MTSTEDQDSLRVMTLNSIDSGHQNDLKNELQSGSPSDLEHLGAALIGRLLGVPITVAGTNFQYGGDAGTAGEQERRLRLECKRYRDTSSLSERELLGQIDQALARDEALEAWVLIATRNVPEQIRQSLVLKGERIGVAIPIVDWSEAGEVAPLAALCASAPDLVKELYSEAAAVAAAASREVSGEVIETLRRNLQSWCLGYESLRVRSKEYLDEIWNSPRDSNARFGQNAAGGRESKRIRRTAVHEGLGAWWREFASEGAPAAIVGPEGVGKTWAVFDWLVDREQGQPIVLTMPSSVAAAMAGVSEASVKRLLAERLFEMTGVRDSVYWLRRLENMLMRPVAEGPVLTVFFDGLNQESSVQWMSLLKVLQGSAVTGRIRAIVSMRTHFFEDKLRKLRDLVAPAVQINLGVFDATPGGEFDKMLEFEGLDRNDLHSDVIELARNPRLFKLVIRLREALVEPGQATLHRLLWVYGRDTFGEIAGRSFSENDWIDWLKEIAARYLRGIKEFSTRTLGDTVKRPDLTARDVYARLSEIVDGQFAERDRGGNWQIDPVLVAHALSVALLNHLEGEESPTFDALNERLASWLDPIKGFDEPAEILRAAISILVEQGRAEPSPIAGVLVTALLQAQNVSNGHRKEIVELASTLPSALLDAIEHSTCPGQKSAFVWAVNAVRNIPKTDRAAFTVIVERARGWLSIVSRDVDTRQNADTESEKLRSKKLLERIGVDRSGPLTVAGIELRLIDNSESRIQTVIPSLMDGFPLASALPVFELSAIVLAIRSRSESWDGLRWLCLFNEADPDDVATALRLRSQQILNRTPERGVNSDLLKRVAARLLWLTGREDDDERAASIYPGRDRHATYKEDYLPRPGRSTWFPLERRHADLVFLDPELSTWARVKRIKDLWLDPEFKPPNSFLPELEKLASEINVEQLHRYTDQAADVHRFDVLEPVLARFAPDLLADIVLRKMRSIDAAAPEARNWIANYSNDHLILSGADAAAAAAARTLRCSGREKDEFDEMIAANRLLFLEILNMEAQDQFDTLIYSELENVFVMIAEILQRLTPLDVDELIKRHGAGPSERQRDLLGLLSLVPVELTNKGWSWVENFVVGNVEPHKKSAFRILGNTDPTRFGRFLQSKGWSGSPCLDVETNHHGSYALIKATRDVPFESVAPRVAPWRLLEAVRIRGAVCDEVRHAAVCFGPMLNADGIKDPDPGSILSVNTLECRSWPVTFSARPRPSPDGQENLRRAFDPELQTREIRSAADIALSRVRAIWRSGGSLYLMPMNPEDFVPVLRHAPEIVEQWLRGMDGPGSDFQRRVRLAEGVFLALCEALLAHNPELGVQLWWALRETVATRYYGAAEVDEHLHMIFRVPDSRVVAKLRMEVIDPNISNSDQDLFDYAVAASFNGKSDWLVRLVEDDRNSKYAWRRRRGETLAGFSSDNVLPISEAWPGEEIRTDRMFLVSNSGRFRWLEACARHWWRAYLEARDPVDAYAAWVLFLRSADRRRRAWMHREEANEDCSDELHKLKIAHARLNDSRLIETCTRRYNELGGRYLRRNTVKGISPWLE